MVRVCSRAGLATAGALGCRSNTQASDDRVYDLPGTPARTRTLCHPVPARLVQFAKQATTRVEPGLRPRTAGTILEVINETDMGEPGTDRNFF